MGEWKEYKLNQLTVKIGSGATPHGGSNVYQNEGISLIRSQNILDLQFSIDGLAFINEEQACALKNVIIEEGDVLLNITGDSVARACKVPKSILPARVNQHVAIIRPEREKLCSDFLLYNLIFQKEELLCQSEIGATRRAITKGMIEQFRIKTPILSEQKAIAGVLSSLDDKIDLLHRQNKTLESMAETLFRQWFVEEASEDWEVVKIGSVLETVLGGTPSTRESAFWDGDIPWINSGEVNNFRILFASKFITELGLKKSNTKLLPKGTTVLAITGATLGQVSLLEIETCANQSVIGVIPNRRIPIPYVFLWVKFKIKEIISNETGGAQPHINKNDINETEITIPDSETMGKGMLVISPLFDKITINCFHISNLEKLRNMLLPKLMSGEVGVEV